MTLFSKKFYWLWFLFFSAIFAAQTIPRIYQESPTNDEPIELTDGYFYWQKGDVTTFSYHPPLSTAVQALPLHFMGLKDSIPPAIKDIQTKAGYFFFLLNNDHVEAMTRNGRFVSLLFGLAIGLVLFFCVQERSFIVVGSTLLLWVFHPTFLTYSSLCLADLPMAFFFFLSILAFQKHLEKPGFSWALGAGALAGMTTCTKFSALALIPIFATLEGWDWYGSRRGLSQRSKDWFVGMAGFLFSIMIIYLPGTLLLPEHHNPWSYFLLGLQNMMDYSRFHHPTYFLGQSSRQNHLLYFPVTFLLKNTLPFLILLLIALITVFRHEQKFQLWLWFPPLFFFMCIIPVQNLGVRYLLPAFPFFILMAGETAGVLWKNHWNNLKTLNGPVILSALLIWNVLSVLLNTPDMIGYANDLIPPKNKALYLADNDLDIGQDVKRLAEVGKEKGWKKVKLAQFGGVLNISYYGIPVESWTQKDLAGPQPGSVYAANMSFFQIGPLFWPDLLPIARGWMLHVPPTGKVGDTWIYFEVPGRPTTDNSPQLSSIRNF